jgi:hypothetical protein
MNVVDTVVQLTAAWSHQVASIGEAERDEEEAGLIDMVIVAVDEGDVDRTREHPAQPIRGDRATRTAAQDEDVLYADHCRIRMTARAIVSKGPKPMDPRDLGPLSRQGCV